MGPYKRKRAGLMQAERGDLFTGQLDRYQSGPVEGFVG